MKKGIFLVLLLSTIFVVKTSASEYKFRVQCFTSGDEGVLELFNAIPEITFFTFPSGSKIYFSGGYFENYTDAKNRLDVVKSKGVNDAFIRVFKGDKFLTEELNRKYLPIAIKQSIENESFNRRRTEEKYRMHFLVDSIKEVKLAKALKVVEIEKEDSVIIPNLIKNIEDQYVTEAPTYKIQLLSANKKETTPNQVLEFNEVIYEIINGNEKIFSVGSFSKESEAQVSLQEIKNKGFSQAKIIGYYKGQVISLDLANQLLNQYLANNQ